MSKPRPRGRPPGGTEQGRKTRQQLYRCAIDLFVSRGYEATTLRQIATRARVSVGLLYRYFPSKRAVVLELYRTLSEEYGQEAAQMQPGSWGTRFLFALRTSLQVLQPHRRTLAALLPVLLGDSEDNLFAPGAAAPRQRVEAVFAAAVTAAVDAPSDPTIAQALGRTLYLGHLAVLLWWLFDRSPRQGATEALLVRLEQLLPSAAVLLALPAAAEQLVGLDGLIRQALLTEPAPRRRGRG